MNDAVDDAVYGVKDKVDDEVDNETYLCYSFVILG